MRTFLVALSAVATCVACTQLPPDEREFSARGQARLYVLRPTFSEIGRAENPVLLVNGRPAATLKYGSYTVFGLTPGTYKLSVQAQPSESDAWNGEWQMSILAAGTYFLAIWNDVEYRQETRAWLFGLPMPYVETTGSSKTLRHEIVAEREALPVVRSLTYIRPIATTHAPLP